MNEYMQILGCKVRDKVTGIEGIATSVSFDLYGCVLVIVTPLVDKDGKHLDGRWYDHHRLTILDNKRVMEIPNFEPPPPDPARRPVAGGQELPSQDR